MEKLVNGWASAHDAMQMALLTRQKLIEELMEENLTLKKELGQVRAALKLVAFSVKRHLGIDIL